MVKKLNLDNYVDSLNFQYSDSLIRKATDIELENDENDLVALYDSLVKKGARRAPDLKIDTRSLFLYPNFKDFCLSPDGLNQNPYPKQLAIATHIFGEWCPRCSIKKFHDISNVPVDYSLDKLADKVSFLEWGVCPRCGATKSELFNSGELNIYNGMVGIAGQRGGKSALIQYTFPYILHRYLMMDSPTLDLGLARGSILTATVTALTYQKAYELLFMPISNTINNSEWFRQLFEILDDAQNKYDEPVYTVKPSYMYFQYKGILFNPSGPNKRTLRGNTRIGGAIDELSWFPGGDDDDERERANANEVYISLERSLITVRAATRKLLAKGNNFIPPALNLCISSPASIRDKMMQLQKVHYGSSTVFCFRLPTWQMNPNLTREDLDDEFKADPVKAERDYGVNPPKSESPWLSETYYWQRSCLTKNRLNYTYKTVTTKSGKRTRYAVMAGHIKPVTMPRSILSLDGGYTNNSFSLSIVIPKEMINTNERYGAEILASIEVAPIQGECVINHTKIIRELVYPLIDLYNVGLVVADRWNSIKLLQDIEEDKNIPTEQYSLHPDDFTMFKEMLYDDRYQYFTFPKPSKSFMDIESTDLENYPHCFKYRPDDHLYFQSITSSIDSRGCAQKGIGLTDDLLRSAVLGISFAIDVDIVEEFNLLNNTKNEPICVGTKQASPATSGIGVKVMF